MSEKEKFRIKLEKLNFLIQTFKNVYWLSSQIDMELYGKEENEVIEEFKIRLHRAITKFIEELNENERRSEKE